MKRKILIMLLLIVMVFLFINAYEGHSGCYRDSGAEKKQQEQTNQILTEINNQLGLPAIKNFQEKKLAKMIFELRDQENLITYAYIVNHMTGQLVFIGKCMGFGLPYSVQYTNPMKKVRVYEGGLALPQADPNGLYMPQGLSATWLMMIDNKGIARPVYVEPQIIVSPFRLH